MPTSTPRARSLPAAALAALAAFAAGLALTTLVARGRRAENGIQHNGIAGTTHGSSLHGANGHLSGTQRAAPLPPSDSPPAPVDPANVRLSWGVFAAVTAAALALMFFVPPPYSTFLFVALLVGSVGIAARRAGVDPRDHLLVPLREAFAPLVTEHGALVTRLCALGALVMAMISTYLWQFVPPDDGALTAAGNWALAAALVLGGAAAIGGGILTPTGGVNTTPTALPRRWGAWLRVALGALFLWLLAEINGEAFDLAGLSQTSYHLQFALLCAGTALVTWGMGSERRVKALSRAEVQDAAPLRGNPIGRFFMREGVQLLALALLALVLRTWQLGDAVRLFVDEVNFSSAVEQFLGEGDLDLIAPRVMSFTGLYTYWQTGGVVMFGRDLTGLRVASVALGTLTVLAVYGLGRMLFDRPTALAAAILLATLPLHIHFSRLGLNNIADPLFGVLAFALFARGLRRGRRMDFALAGAALGLTQYFYEGGRLLYPAVMAAWGVLVYLFAVDGVNAAPAKRRLVRSGLVTTALTALLVAAPVYYTLVALDAPLTSRFGEVGMGSGYWIKLLFPDPGINPWPEQLRRLRDPLLLMISHPERSLFYGGGQPLLLAYLVPPFLLGAALLLWRLRKPGALLLLVWLVGAAVGNSLLVGTMDAARYVVVAPALALVCAVGLVGVLRLVFVTTTPKPHTPPHQTMQRLQPHRYALPLAALAVALFAGGQAVYYFGPHLERYNDQFREFDPLGKGQDAIFRALDFRTGTEIHLISTHEYNEAFANGMLSFLRGTELRAYTHTPDEITPEFLNSLGRNVDHAFFIETGELLALARIRQAFTLEPPRARDYDVRPGDLFVLYYAPAELPGGAP